RRSCPFPNQFRVLSACRPCGRRARRQVREVSCPSSCSYGRYWANCRANIRTTGRYASILVYYLDQMRDLGDHATRLWRVGKLGNAPDLVELQTDQRPALAEMPPQRTAGLANSYCLATMLFGTHPMLRLIDGGLDIDIPAPRLQRRDLDVTARGHRARRILTLKRVKCGAHDSVRIRRADRFRHHVLHAKRLEYRAHRSAGDDAGPRRCGAEIHPARAMSPANVVMERTALAQRHSGQSPLGCIGRLADR